MVTDPLEEEIEVEDTNPSTKRLILLSLEKKKRCC